MWAIRNVVTGEVAYRGTENYAHAALIASGWGREWIVVEDDDEEEE